MINEYEQNLSILKVAFEGKMHTTSNKFSINNHWLIKLFLINLLVLLKLTQCLNIFFSQIKTQAWQCVTDLSKGL